MKYRFLFFLTAILVAPVINAQPVPIVIPSGQQLYFDLHSSFNYPQNNYAVVCAPIINNDSRIYGVWDGYTKPGGDIVIPDTITYEGSSYAVTQIGYHAFYNCNAIQSIVIPNTVSKIWSCPINGCTSLRKLIIGTGLESAIQVHSGYASYLPSSILGGCTSLDTIYYYADSCYQGQMFGGSIGQHTVVIVGDNVRYIGQNMLEKRNNMFKSIERVVVGSSVATIGNNAFLNCGDLVSITFCTQNPPMLGSGVFEGVNTDSVLCTIPCGRTSYYFNQWSNLFNYTETSSGYTLNLASNYDLWGTVEIIQQPSCEGNAIIGATALCGYYFVRWSDGNTDNPRIITLQNDTYLTAIFASSYNVPDTVIVHDTTIVNNNIHDTTYLPIYLHDTVPMTEYLHDTIYLPQYIHDTTIVNNYFRDTIYLPQYIHDTSFVSIHDTTYISVPIHDTTYITQIDTLTLTQYDTVTNTVIDTLWLTQTDTLWLHDTIIIHDTVYIIQEGIDGVDVLNAKVYLCQGQIVVEGADGNTVRLYDINGRVLANRRDDFTPMRFDVPASGTYLIKIGNHVARKVVVIR